MEDVAGRGGGAGGADGEGGPHRLAAQEAAWRRRRRRRCWRYGRQTPGQRHARQDRRVDGGGAVVAAVGGTKLGRRLHARDCQFVVTFVGRYIRERCACGHSYGHVQTFLQICAYNDVYIVSVSLVMQPPALKTAFLKMQCINVCTNRT